MVWYGMIEACEGALSAVGKRGCKDRHVLMSRAAAGVDGPEAGWKWEENYRAPPAGSRHSCQPILKLHILPHSMNFSSGKGVVRGCEGQQLEFALMDDGFTDLIAIPAAAPRVLSQKAVAYHTHPCALGSVWGRKPDVCCTRAPTRRCSPQAWTHLYFLLSVHGPAFLLLQELPQNGAAFLAKLRQSPP